MAISPYKGERKNLAHPPGPHPPAPSPIHIYTGHGRNGKHGLPVTKGRLYMRGESLKKGQMRLKCGLIDAMIIKMRERERMQEKGGSTR